MARLSFWFSRLVSGLGGAHGVLALPSLTLLLALNLAVIAPPAASGAGAPATNWVVTNSIPATNEITFEQFLKEVAEANLDYAAQRYNVSIAEAAVAAAKVFPNPTLNLGGSR